MKPVDLHALPSILRGSREEREEVVCAESMREFALAGKSGAVPVAKQPDF
jgi:hypothetical protein